MGNESPAALLIDTDGNQVGTADSPLRTDPTGDTAQPISAESLPLPTGAATDAKQDTGNTSLSNMETTLTNIKNKTDNIPTDPAKESGKLTTIDSTLTAIKSTDGIKKIVDALPAGTNNIGDVDLASAIPTGSNEIGKVAQGTKGAGGNAWPEVLYDASGNAVGVVLDGAVYRLQTQTKIVRASDGAQINPATEETLALIKSTDGIKKIVDALPAGTNNIGDVDLASSIPAGSNEIGKVAQGTKAAGSGAWPAVLYDASGNAIGVVLDGAVYRLQTQTKIVRASDGAQINPATEETLALIKTTDGIKKIVDMVNANIQQWLGSTAPTVGRKAEAASVPIVLPTEQIAQAVGETATVLPAVMGGVDHEGNVRYFALDDNGSIKVVVVAPTSALPQMVNPYYNQSDGAIVANSFKRIMTYTVPTGYNGWLIRFTSWMNEAGFSRITAETELGSLQFVTNVFTSGDAYTAPGFAGTTEAEVTTQLGSANNVTVTVTYTNEVGVGSRTSTFGIPKSTIVGARFILPQQSGDVGILSVQNISVSPSGGAGAIKLLGFVQLAFHDDLSATIPTETNYGAGAVSFPPGTVLGFEYQGGIVSKQRIIEALIQLVET